MKKLVLISSSCLFRWVKLYTPYKSVPNLKISLAFVTDPWGTSIELNEGLG